MPDADLAAFSPDYWAAREKFRDAARASGASLNEYVNPAPAPSGRDGKLTTDVALLGPRDAGRVLLVNAGTHGVEAFAGSAIEIGFLAGLPTLPNDVRVVIVHAINPHGFAWLRRVTEENVDLNRNFVDHDGQHPSNDAYDALHPALCPERWDAAALAEMERVIGEYVDKHGAFALQAVVTRGQYDHPDGIFYGGRQTTWSNSTFRDILAKHVTGARRIAFIDLHTGLGAYGDAEMIGGGWMGDRYGDIAATPPPGKSSSAPLVGVIARAVREAARERRRHQRDARIRHLPGARRAARALGGQLAPRARRCRQRARPRNQGGYPQAAVPRRGRTGRSGCWRKASRSSTGPSRGSATPERQCVQLPSRP